MAFWVGYGYSFWDYGNGIDLEWRLSTAMQFVPAVIFLSGVPFIPERYEFITPNTIIILLTLE